MKTPMTTALRIPGEQHAPFGLRRSGSRAVNGSDLLVGGFRRTVDTLQNGMRTHVAAAQHEPAGAFGNEEYNGEEEQRRQRFGTEHAAPQLRNPYLLHPRGGVGGRFGRFEYLEVHEVGRQEPDRDGQLVKRHECPAPARHGDLGNIHRRNDRHHADAHAAHDAVNDQLREVGTDGTADGRNGEQHGRQQHRQLAPETVAQHSGHGHAADRTDERTPNEPSLLHGVQRELRGHTGYRTRNDRRVVPEQNPAYGGYQ